MTHAYFAKRSAQSVMPLTVHIASRETFAGAPAVTLKPPKAQHAVSLESIKISHFLKTIDDAVLRKAKDSLEQATPGIHHRTSTMPVTCRMGTCQMFVVPWPAFQLASQKPLWL